MQQTAEPMVLDPDATEIWMIDQKRKFRAAITRELAQKYLDEGAAMIHRSDTICKLFDRRSLRDYILERDGPLCQICKDRRANKLHRIVPRSEGGIRSPANCIAVCDHCCNVKSKRTKNNRHTTDIEWAIPVYKFGNNHIAATIENPSHYMMEEINRRSSMELYCDASTSSDQDCYSIAVVAVGRGRVQTVTEMFTRQQGEPIDSMYAELKAIELALKLMTPSPDIEAVIYSDLDYIRSLLNKRKSKVPCKRIILNHLASQLQRNGLISIQYIGRKAKRKIYYRMAHKFASAALRTQRKNSVKGMR